MRLPKKNARWRATGAFSAMNVNASSVPMTRVVSPPRFCVTGDRVELLPHAVAGISGVRHAEQSRRGDQRRDGNLDRAPHRPCLRAIRTGSARARRACRRPASAPSARSPSAVTAASASSRAGLPSGEASTWSHGSPSAAIFCVASSTSCIDPRREVAVDRGDDLAEAGAARVRVAALPDVLDALHVVDEIRVRRVGEARCSSSWSPEFEPDGHALRHQLRAGEHRHAVQDAADRLALRQRHEHRG